jgi:IS30 family transposase
VEDKVRGEDGKWYPARALDARERAQRMKRIKRHRDAGWSLRRIAKELNVSPSTVLADLRRDP